MMDPKVIEEMQAISRKARVFLSMPYVEGLTPRILNQPGRYEVYPTDEGVERRHGIFAVDEAGLSPLDHGGLYGDACFEGILIIAGRIFLFKEHLLRWWQSAERLRISMPYRMEDIAWYIVRTVQEVGFTLEEKGYMRPVITRGTGNLGINPRKCVAPTIYVIVSTIQLYPEEAYRTGIELSITRRVRRPDKEIIDPNVKSNNYLNNIYGLLDTLDHGTWETLMLTQKGFVAEATADNIFIVRKEEGWEDNPAKVTLFTPIGEYCLIGLTRNLIIREARSLGYNVIETPSMLPTDFLGEGKEAFMTGTGCGLMPVIGIEGLPIGEGRPGPVTEILLSRVKEAMASSDHGLSIRATKEETIEYLKREIKVPLRFS